MVLSRREIQLWVHVAIVTCIFHGGIHLHPKSTFITEKLRKELRDRHREQFGYGKVFIHFFKVCATVG